MTFEDDSNRPQLTRAVQGIIALNVAIYFLQLTVVGPDNMLQALGFEARNLSRSWWTVVTYMFVHAGFLHIALNMYTLYLFGPRLEWAWSPTEFTKFYIVSGIGGWVFHLLFARESLLVGASAAVYGVMLAYALRWPNDEVFVFGVIPMKVKWMVTLLVGLNLVAGMAPGGNAGGVAYLAHLGGLAAAWLYLRTAMTGGSLDRLRQRVSSVPDLPDETPRAVPRSSPRSREQRGGVVDEIVARSQAALRDPTGPEPRPIGAKASTPPGREDLNAVLDKISRSGLESLTTSERRLLEELSRELRSKD